MTGPKTLIQFSHLVFFYEQVLIFLERTAEILTRQEQNVTSCERVVESHHPECRIF